MEREHADHSLSAARARRRLSARGLCAPTLSQRPPSSDTRTSEDLARPFCLPLATHAHLARLARVPALTGRALASASPGRPRLGLGLPAGLGSVPGLGTRYAVGAGRGAASVPRSPRPPLLPFPAAAAMNSRCGLLAPARSGAGGGGSRVPLSAPPPTSRPAPPSPLRENRLAHDITQPRDFTSLLTRWPEPETAVSKYRHRLGPSLRPWNWRGARDPLYLLNKEP